MNTISSHRFLPFDSLLLNVFHLFNLDDHGSRIFGLANFPDFSSVFPVVFFLPFSSILSVLFGEFHKYRNLFNKYRSIKKSKQKFKKMAKIHPFSSPILGKIPSFF